MTLSTGPPTSWFKAFLSQLPLLLLVLAILVLVTVLGYTGNMTGAMAFGVIMALTTAVGVVSVAVLISETPNATLIAHLVFTAFLISAVMVLRLHQVLTDADVNLFLTPFIGAGVALAPSSAATRPTITATGATRGSPGAPAG